MASVNTMYNIIHPAQVLEILTYEVDAAYIDAYLNMDYEVWSLGESKFPGYIGKDTWISKTHPGQITHIIYWASKETWKGLPEDAVMQLRREAQKRVPGKYIKRISAYHVENELVKIAEFRSPSSATYKQPDNDRQEESES